jgi:dTDP-4-dehydrorhamnose 3,5-epimerase
VSNAWDETPLPGVLVRRIPSYPDERGSFTELWRAGWFDGLPHGTARTMCQANLSRSLPRVLRGLHLHRRQADFWVVAEGTAFVALVDVRPALAESGPPAVHTIDAPAGTAIYLPAGVAHGFYARDGLTLVYLVTNEYDGTDELGFAFDDPQAAVPWPDLEPVVSQRDRDAGTLAELIERLRVEGLGND